MRLLPPKAAALAAAAGLLAGCGHGATGRKASSPDRADAGLSPDERARKECRIAFARCAPPANYPPDLDVGALDLRSLVQISWRLDLSDALCEKAAKRLRGLAQRGDLETVREIATDADAAAVTLGRCRCEGEKFRPEYEKQGVGALVASRLPPAEQRDPAHWAARVDAHLAALRSLSRQSASAFAGGDQAAGAALEDKARAEEQRLCETVHAAHAALLENERAEMHGLVHATRARESGEASAENARRAVERAEARSSCAAEDRAPADAE